MLFVKLLCLQICYVYKIAFIGPSIKIDSFYI